MKHFANFFLLFTVAILFLSCGGKKLSSSEQTVDTMTNVPVFNADSAMLSIRTQCAFGPRVLESKAHENCGRYISDAFKHYGCSVSLQKATFTRYDGVKMKGYNIIAQTRPGATRRIVLCAHWDSRPWAD